MDAELLKKEISGLLLSGGAVKVGFASIGEESGLSSNRENYMEWLSAGNAAGMVYLHRNMEVRFNPELLMPGARSVIMTAFSYTPAELRHAELPYISIYAYGTDYHDVIKKRIRDALKGVADDSATQFRVCVDSVPLRERFWAVKSGLGFRCDNGMIAVDGYGQQIFLATILTTLNLPPDSPDERECCHCGACRRSCPGGALNLHGEIDCRKCISYLTIEHHGPLDETGRRVMATDAGRNTLFGCDRCVAVCPLNRNLPPTEIEEFHPDPKILSLSKTDIESLSEHQLKTLLSKSAMKRALKRYLPNS